MTAEHEPGPLDFVDDIARYAAVTDEGPDALGIPDEDPGPLRDTGPRAEDGDQDPFPAFHKPSLRDAATGVHDPDVRP